VIVAEEELHAFFHVPLVVDHHPSIYRGCRVSIALNNLCLALLLRNSLLGKTNLS
jgi:hypothetical protein